MNRLAYAPEREHPDYYDTDPNDQLLADMAAQLANQGELKIDEHLTLDLTEELIQLLSKYEHRHITYLSKP